MNTKSTTKDKPNLKVTTSSSQRQQNLSRSLTYPSKLAHVEAMKKSTDGILLKTENKRAQAAASNLRSRKITNTKEPKTNHGNSKQRTSLTNHVNTVAKSITSVASL